MTPAMSQLASMVKLRPRLHVCRHSVAWITTSSRDRKPAAAAIADAADATESPKVPIDASSGFRPSIHPDIDLTFCDKQEAFRSKTNWELVRALVVLRLCSVNALVERNKQVMHLSQRMFGKRLFEFLMRLTFYGHFVAGADRLEIEPVIRRNRRFGVKAILDYSAEKDISEEEAKEKVEEGEKIFEEGSVKTSPSQLPPAAAVARFQPQVEFANRASNVISAKTYYYESERQCDNHMQIFLDCIDAVSDSTLKEGMAAIKLTALGRPQLLLQISGILVQAQRFFDLMHEPNRVPSLLGRVDKTAFRQRLEQLGVELDFDKEKKWLSIIDADNDSIDLLAWENLVEAKHDLAKIFCVKSLQSGEMEQIVPILSDEGRDELRKMLHRIETIVQHALESGVRVMIDAEQSYFQPAIRRITMELMRKYNKQSNVVFNTYQCYLKSALESARTDLHLAEKENFHFGAKLVRGAYMDQERARAKTLQYEDPINPSYEATNSMYHSVLDQVFQAISRREKGKVAVMIATHNEDTVRLTVSKMKEYGVYPSDRLICFGQLLGMCDHMSFPLGQAGYSVYKYVPYGAVSEVMPYLGRRACENRGLIGNASKERRLMQSELLRRVSSGQLFYKPA